MITGRKPIRIHSLHKQPIEVVFSDHALVRILERFPQFKNIDEKTLAKHIKDAFYLTSDHRPNKLKSLLNNGGMDVNYVVLHKLDMALVIPKHQNVVLTVYRISDPESKWIRRGVANKNQMPKFMDYAIDDPLFQVQEEK